MPTFSDNKEREWTIRLDALQILRIREECDPKFMLEDSDESQTYMRLQADPVLLCRVLYVLCAEQREERKVSEKDFYMEVIGDAVDSATKAMLDSIVLFSPRRTRELLATSAEKHAKIQQLVAARAVQKISDPELEEKVLAAIEGKLDAEIQHAMRQLSVSSSPGSSA